MNRGGLVGIKIGLERGVYRTESFSHGLHHLFADQPGRIVDMGRQAGAVVGLDLRRYAESQAKDGGS